MVPPPRGPPGHSAPRWAWEGPPPPRYISFPRPFSCQLHLSFSGTQQPSPLRDSIVSPVSHIFGHNSSNMSGLPWAVAVGAAVAVMAVLGVGVVRADECSLTPVIHILSYPGCTSKPIPSFACQGRCTSYVQVGGGLVCCCDLSCPAHCCCCCCCCMRITGLVASETQ